jgi:hypothetical protein
LTPPARRAPPDRLLGPALALLLVASGCPLPQPLAEVAPGQPVTPPRIIVEDVQRQITITPIDTLLRVTVGCATGPSYALKASLNDVNTTEIVVARWFVNYDPALPAESFYRREDQILAPPATVPDPTLRETPVFTFEPYLWDPEDGTGDGTGNSPGALHIVELVVSNGFDGNPDQSTVERPYRTPAAGYEVQVYRWVFLGVPQGGTAVCP